MANLISGMCGENWRTLTQGEISLATKVFADAIDYSLVKIHSVAHNTLQNENDIVTPNGEMYFPGKHYKLDFSTASPDKRALFIHEMVHVWQHQNKLMNLYTSAALEAARYAFYWRHKAYQYTLSEGADLLDYRLEQQASIIEDYYRVQFEGITISATTRGGDNMQNQIPRSQWPNALRRVLMNFIANPRYVRNPDACHRAHRTNARPQLVCSGDKT